MRRPELAASAPVPAAMVDLPTPPLPVNRRILGPEIRPGLSSGHSDSTRFFNPFSAVSMRIFSPLRLSIPINGIDTSSANR